MSLVNAIKAKQSEGLFPVISEIKCRSEKHGDLIKGRDPIMVVKEMVSCPVAGISVVTEKDHFGGSMELLKRVVDNVSVPVLHKDFIRDDEQIKESKRIGASAILLISSILTRKELESLIEVAKKYGIETLVEVHTEEDIDKIKGLDFDILGINNRDIKVLETDDSGVEVTEYLISKIPKKGIIISESAVKDASDIKKVKKAGADAVLVGTAVMLSEDIKGFLTSLIEVGW